MSLTNKKQKTHDDIYFLQNKKLLIVNDSMIETRSVATVRDILLNIKKKIIVLEHYNSQNKTEEPDNMMKEIYIQDDVVYKFVKMNRWRRGTGFLCLQISSNKESRIKDKPMGCARICCFTTDTIHHDAFSFGKTPDVDDAMFMINHYVESDQIIVDLNELKTHHPTELSAETLCQYIKW